jgi:hypothetical protein
VTEASFDGAEGRLWRMAGMLSTGSRGTPEAAPARHLRTENVAMP